MKVEWNKKSAMVVKQKTKDNLWTAEMVTMMMIIFIYIFLRKRTYLFPYFIFMYEWLCSRLSPKKVHNTPYQFQL